MAAPLTLTAWLTSESSLPPALSVQQSSALGCLGLHATSAFPARAQLGALPAALLLTARTGLLRDSAAAAVFGALAHPSPPLALLLCLAHARSGGGPWHAYAASLPAALPSLLHCPQGAVGALEALGLHCHVPFVLRERSALREGCAALARAAAAAAGGGTPPAWATPAALLWAHGAFSSRAMLLPTGEAAMVPLFDMANHCEASPISFALVPGGAQDARLAPPPSQAARAALAALARCAGGAAGASTTLPSSAFEALLQQPPPAPAAAAAMPFDAAAGSAPLRLALVLGGAGVAAGSELLLNYGRARSSLSFAALSGFVPPRNRGDRLPVRFCGGALALGSGGAEAGSGAAEAFMLSFAGLPLGLLRAAAQARGCSPGEAGGAGAGAGAGGGGGAGAGQLTRDPELEDFLGSCGDRAQGEGVARWLAEQCSALSRALGAARASAAPLALQSNEALALARALSVAACELLDNAARELLDF